ncbi:MAG: aminopeptidase P N-terminal domain-containing protein [Flavobacteriaceae bacterium]|nr:aminopeptidase P N-terminal domain-containing protein [Flavobacteriaceae bacterium]
MKKILLLIINLLFGLSSHLGVFGQEKDQLPFDFHKERRESLRNLMPHNSVAILFGAPIRNRSNSVDYPYHQDPNFYYLTGWLEPHSVLILFSEKQSDSIGMYNEVIFVQESDPYMEMWEGPRKGVQGALSMGFQRVFPKSTFLDFQMDISSLDRILFFEFKNDIEDTQDSSDLYDLVEIFKSKINYPQHFDIELYGLLESISVGHPEDSLQLKNRLIKMVQDDSKRSQNEVVSFFLGSINRNILDIKQDSQDYIRKYRYDFHSLRQYLTQLREIKTDQEIRLLKKAIQITVQGHLEVMKAINEDMTESEVQGMHEFVHKKYGAAHQGFPSIVGAGGNGCILHYTSNNKINIKGELILMDIGAEYQYYTADVTRTIPVSGKFNEQQRALYEIVYQAQEAGINAVQVGNSFSSIYQASSQVIKDGLLALGIIQNPEEFSRYFPHGVTHHIGLDVHDLGEYGVLKNNMIITVEPGIYIPSGSNCDPKWWDIGIRIEDDILVTNHGPVNLSISAPKHWSEIENTIAEPSAFDDFELPVIDP